MPILFSSHSDGASEMIASTLKDISASGMIHTGSGLDLSDVSTSLPIDVFHVGGPDLAKMKSLIDAAQEVGWRYLLQSGGEIVADIHLGRKDGKLKFVSMALDGPTLSSTIQALHAAEEDARVQQQDFQLRELNLAWCYFTALWLHNETQDLIMPIEPTIGHKLNLYQLYNLNDVTQMLLSRLPS